MSRSPRNNRYKNSQGGSRYAALAILVLILLAVGAYLIFAPATSITPLQTTSVPSEPQRPVHPPAQTSQATPQRIPALPEKPQTDHKVTAQTSKGDENKPVINKQSKGALLAIIIDDMGTSVQEARSLSAIGVPVTFSIIPGLRNSKEVAAFAEEKGIESMIHIPMQSKGWPGRRLESNGLLISMSEKDIAERVEGFVRSIPKAAGANNHTGSEFTEHEDKMRAVLEVLKGKGIYYVDSVTSPETVGEDIARELGMKTARRQVFLDNEQNETYILGQLEQAVRLARKKGSAIAICHPHPTTIHTLESALPALVKQGISFVPASRLVK